MATPASFACLACPWSPGWGGGNSAGEGVRSPLLSVCSSFPQSQTTRFCSKPQWWWRPGLGDRGQGCSSRLRGCFGSQSIPIAPQCRGSPGVSPGDGDSGWGPHNWLGTSGASAGAVSAPLCGQKPPSRGRDPNDRWVVGQGGQGLGPCPCLARSPTNPQPFASSLTI